jgi:hypothetical protein
MKSALAASTLLVFIAVPAVFALVESPPSIFLGVDPPSQNIPVGESATFTVNAYPQGKWATGHVSFNVTNLPKGVTATFNPERIDDIAKSDVAVSNMTVKVDTDAPQGKITLTVSATGKEDQEGINLNATFDVTLNIVSSTQKTTSNTTSTVKTSTNTTTTTLSNNSSSIVASKTVLITTTLTTTRESTVTVLDISKSSPTTTLANRTPPDPTIPTVAFIIIVILLAVAVLALRGKIR